MSQKANITQVTNDNNWESLCNILGGLGVENNNKELILNWDSPDSDQFEFLAKIFGKLVKNPVKGDYDYTRKCWVIN